MKFAVLFDLALQMQRNGLVALLRDILTCQKALIDASCLQNFVQVRGTGAVVTRCQAIDLQSEAVQMRCQTRYKIEFNNDFRKDLANRQQVHAPADSFLGGFSKSASPNRTVELDGRLELPTCALRMRYSTN